MNNIDDVDMDFFYDQWFSFKMRNKKRANFKKGVYKARKYKNILEIRAARNMKEDRKWKKPDGFFRKTRNIINSKYNKFMGMTELPDYLDKKYKFIPDDDIFDLVEDLQ